MTAAGPQDLDVLFADHMLLIAALEAPPFWNRVFAERLGHHGIGAVHVEPVGTGQVASCLRVRLAHDAPDAPRSVVAKTASADALSRATSATLRHGEIEVGFYDMLAPQCRARIPHCHLAALSGSADDFLLVLEDLEGFTQADQIASMSPDDAGAALDELAALHATWWGHTPPGTASFLVDRGEPSAHATLLAMLHQGFVQRYADRLDPEVMQVADQLLTAAGTYLVDRPGPTAVVHGDFRPDNLLVGPERVAVVDWQTVTVGPALADVSYFLGGALLPEVRTEHEGELLQRYRAGLASEGIELDASVVEDGYRRYALDGLVMAIGASQVVGRTDRGDDMFCVMADRAARHALEAQSFSLIAT